MATAAIPSAGMVAGCGIENQPELNHAEINRQRGYCHHPPLPGNGKVGGCPADATESSPHHLLSPCGRELRGVGPAVDSLVTGWGGDIQPAPGLDRQPL